MNIKTWEERAADSDGSRAAKTAAMQAEIDELRSHIKSGTWLADKSNEVDQNRIERLENNGQTLEGKLAAATDLINLLRDQ